MCYNYTVHSNMTALNFKIMLLNNFFVINIDLNIRDSPLENINYSFYNKQA